MYSAVYSSVYSPVYSAVYCEQCSVQCVMQYTATVQCCIVYMSDSCKKESRGTWGWGHYMEDLLLNLCQPYHCNALLAVLHNAHCTLHNIHFTLHTAHCTLYTSHCTLHTAHFTLHYTHCLQQSSQYTMHNTTVQCPLHTANCR